jgi:hypothetical protein
VDGHGQIGKEVCSGSIEDVNSWMLGEEATRDHRSLMVAGDDVDRYAPVSEILQGLECHLHELGGDFAAI